MIPVNSKIPQGVNASNNARGFTLIELMVSLTIASILMTFIFQFFITQSDNFAESRKSSEMQQELRWAMNYVSGHMKLAGNGVPPTCGWPVLRNGNGLSDAPDTLEVLGSFRSLVMTTDQAMGNEGSQVKVTNTDGIDEGDLAVISDGTFTEIFYVTKKTDIHLWHAAHDPWNDDNKLDHRYALDSTITVVSHYKFFVEEGDDGISNLMVETQSYEPQILIGDVDDFQIRFKMKGGEWLDETDDITDIRMIELTIRAKSPNPIKNYIDPVYGDEYKRLEMKSLVIPKNIVIL